MPSKTSSSRERVNLLPPWGFGPQHLVPPSSRRPLYVVKFLRKTERFTGSEEAAGRPSRRTHDRGCSLHFDFLTGSFAGTTILFGPIEH